MNDDFLIIKYSGRNSFEKFFSDRMQEAGVAVLDEDVIYPAQNDSRKNKIKKVLKLLGYKKIVQKYDNIIVFADGRLPVILIYYLKKRDTRLIIWRWNSVGKIDDEFNQLKKYGEIWTFDRKDAELNGWKLNTQFYFNNNENNNLMCEPYARNGAYFVGDNKGREKNLETIYNLLTRANVTCDFWVCNKKGNFAGIKSIENFISYEDIINEVKKHSILIDLVKEGQTGITIRVMEALFYSKKLITNNVAVKQYSFYNPANVFIYGVDDKSRIMEFLTNPYVEISKEIKEQYLIDQWLRNFIKDKNNESLTRFM